MWDKMVFPIRRVWDGVALRLGIRKTGLLRLRRDVRSCEYRDVQVMWEMLNRNEAGYVRSPAKSKKRFCWNFFQWARCTPYLYRSYR
ncbi:Elongation factor 4 [Melia azedarach]|uniref:Elongation factor 4 n=1 Tax=Melia azedarach TaxID=155640 RepID=A0ACC1WRX2_MELAZ|nr:Elongation factor 4 [Melia azedarach]